MIVGSLEPTTMYLTLDESSTLRQHRSDDRFSITRVDTTAPLADAIQKSSSVAALLVSISLRPLKAGDFRLWVDGKIVPTRRIPAFRANVVDLAAGPACWAGRGSNYVHFHVRNAAIDDVAQDLGYERVGAFRPSVVENDIVLAQITKTILPHLGREAGPPAALALDHFELILGAHLLQRYGGVRQTHPPVGAGLAVWQRRRASELLRENLIGRVRLSELARECNVSLSHFVRSFKASFGVTPHRWLLERRVERAQELLARSTISLAEIAIQSGFADQAALTRTFHRLIGMTPGRWRHEHARRPKPR